MSKRVSLVAIAVLAACTSSNRSTEVPYNPSEHTKEYKLEQGSESDPEARDKWFWAQRAYPAATIPVEVHRRAVMQEHARTRALADGDAAWTNLGPAPLLDIPYGAGSAQNSSGRALALAIHPSDPRMLLLGTAQGGIWKSTDRGATWRTVGEQALPTLAVNVIRYSPSDANVVFAGTGEPNGGGAIYGAGLMRSGDGGETWELLPNRGAGWDFNFSAISGLQFDARDPNTLYVTTATIVPVINVFFRTPPEMPQTGLFKSTDGGRSWTLLRAAKRHTVGTSLNVGFMDLEYGGAAAPDRMYVSEYYGGILRSDDAGATWRYVTPLKSNGYGAFPADVPHISYTTTASRRYLLLNRLPHPSNEIDFRRPEIALSASNPQVVYAGYDAPNLRLDFDNNGVFDAVRDRRFTTSLLFKSVDGGETWRWLGTRHDGIPDYCGSQCTYDNTINVHPTNPDDVLIGGFPNYARYAGEPFANPARLLDMPWRGMIYRTHDGGTSWTDITPHCTRLSPESVRIDSGLPVYPCQAIDPSKVIHPDIHAIVRGPNEEIYVANDGGIYRGAIPKGTPGGRRRSSTTKPEEALAGSVYHWENLNNNLSTLQFYRIASHPTDPNILLGGMQDNSCGYWNGETWEGWGGGDGTVAFFDPLDPKYVYLGSQFAVHRHDGKGTKAFTTAAGWRTVFQGEEFTGEGETTSFVPVFALDPVVPSITYGASDRAIYRSTTRGTNNARLGPSTATTDGIPTTIAVSPVDHNIVWAATDRGAIYRYTIAANGTTTVARVDGSLPDRYVTRIVAGHDSENTVYAVFNGYNANTPTTPGKVFMSTDRGATWQNVSGNLPDIPVTAIALDPQDANRMWISTDAAVYSTRDRGKTWESERRNMPVVAVIDLDYNAKTGNLVAATFGRGVWRMRVASGAAQ
jgi:photosystem II stability/assembly factor-like uncharacterized protein